MRFQAIILILITILVVAISIVLGAIGLSLKNTIDNQYRIVNTLSMIQADILAIRTKLGMYDVEFQK